MAGIYKIGFDDGTPVADAKEQALAAVRAGGDADDVTAGPDVVQSAPSPDVVQGETHAESGTYLIRIVTGIPDPVPILAARRAEAARTSATDTVLGRLAELPADKLAALAALLDQVEKA